MYDYDRSNFIAFLKDFPGQIASSLNLMRNFSVDYQASDISSIVFTGMGGSAISADLLLGFCDSELRVPAVVNRDYSIPGFVNSDTLFIAVSYSGNTEETLSALEKAKEKSAKIIGISSGGKLEDVCSENGYSHIKISEGLPPRQALGNLFFPLLKLFEKLELITLSKEDLAETEQVLQDLSDRFDPMKSQKNNLANHIAQSIYHAIPVIYTGVPALYPVSVRWRNQFNENSKALAFSNVFPELNHNEIVGWEGTAEVNQNFRVIFLRAPGENARVKQRIRITKDILRSKRILFGEIFAEGNSRLARMFSLIYTGDWASYYLAMLNEKDPIKIESIDFLKQKMSEVEAAVEN